MAESSNKTRRRRNLRVPVTRPGKAKKQTHPAVSESESSNNTLEGGRNWIDLPYDVTASILSRLSMFDILENSQKVCLTWRRICKDPMTWCTIDMEFDIHLVQQKLNGNFTVRENTPNNREEYLRQILNFNVNKMCRHAIDLSCGNLVDISIRNCGTYELLKHMTESSSRIRRLSIVFSEFMTIEGVGKVASKLPLLEDLEISYTQQSCAPYDIAYSEQQKQRYKYLEVIGHSCPLLKSLKLNNHPGCVLFTREDNGDAFAIAGTMHGLKNLQLFGNALYHKGLHKILEGCPRLESLDIRQCNYLYLKREGWGLGPVLKGSSHLEELKTRCFGKITEPGYDRPRVPYFWGRSESDYDDYEHSAIDRIVDRIYNEYLKYVKI